MEREEQWQEQGGGEQTEEGGPSGAPVEPTEPEVEAPNESESEGGGDEGESPAGAA